MMEQKIQIEEIKKKLLDLENELAKNKELAKQIEKEESSPLFDIYSWTAPDRIYVPHDKNWYFIVGFFSLIGVTWALLTDNFLLVGAIIAIVFLLYALNTVPPHTVTHAITNKGIRIDKELFTWKDIDCFWVSERSNKVVINIELTNMGGRLIALLGDGDLSKILSELVKHEDYREPKGFHALISRITEGKHKKLNDFAEN